MFYKILKFIFNRSTWFWMVSGNFKNIILLLYLKIVFIINYIRIVQYLFFFLSSVLMVKKKCFSK